MTPEPVTLDLVIQAARLVRWTRRVGGPEASTTWRALAIFDEHGPLRVGDYATIDQLTQPAATELLKRLSGEGLLCRKRDPHDGRASVLEMTDLGRERLSELRSRAGLSLDHLFSGITPAELEELTRTTAILARVLGKSTTIPPRN